MIFHYALVRGCNFTNKIEARQRPSFLHHKERNLFRPWTVFDKMRMGHRLNIKLWEFLRSDQTWPFHDKRTPWPEDRPHFNTSTVCKWRNGTESGRLRKSMDCFKYVPSPAQWQIQHRCPWVDLGHDLSLGSSWLWDLTHALVSSPRKC